MPSFAIDLGEKEKIVMLQLSALSYKYEICRLDLSNGDEMHCDDQDGDEMIRNMSSRLLCCMEDAVESSDVDQRGDSSIAKIMLCCCCLLPWCLLVAIVAFESLVLGVN